MSAHAEGVSALADAVLRAGLWLGRNPRRWTRTALAIDVEGESCDPRSPAAVRWGLEGRVMVEAAALGIDPEWASERLQRLAVSHLGVLHDGEELALESVDLHATTVEDVCRAARWLAFWLRRGELAPSELLTGAEVVALTGARLSHLYKMMSRGTFPRSVRRPGDRRNGVGWERADVLTWIAERRQVVRATA